MFDDVFGFMYEKFVPAVFVHSSQRLSQEGASYVHWIQLGVVSHSTLVDPSTYLQYMLLAPEIRVSHVLVHQQERRAGFQFTSVFQQYVVPATIGGVVT